MKINRDTAMMLIILSLSLLLVVVVILERPVALGTIILINSAQFYCQKGKWSTRCKLTIYYLLPLQSLDMWMIVKRDIDEVGQYSIHSEEMRKRQPDKTCASVALTKAETLFLASVLFSCLLD